MTKKDLIVHKVHARAVNIPLKRPMKARHTFTHWLAIVIDIETKGDVTGRAYICPYLSESAISFMRIIDMLGESCEGRTIAPSKMFDENLRKI